ncbi:hypothetical protein BJ508DRAFT_415033 [Ascobolus immersus RN42]|uniref:DUF7580 domain-containing protein n=1 Tax=Ascobolus immersus RN42 TaxID=1160509 RepID=A0A3N4I4I2_ASCIM|nr:hypothetical protein BJ508DRAFT_415033 [Ascobolus immersus RN42]
MCASMLEFRNTGTGGQWHFHERRKFFQKEENRKKWVSQLAKWNKRLKRIVKHGKLDGATTDEAERALCRSNQSTAIDPSNTANHLRILSRRLFTTLSGCWQCQCTKPHEGRFSLGNCNMLGSDPTTCGVQFQFLVCDSIQSQPDSTMSWHEATVSIMPAYRPICSDPTENLKTICEAVRMVRGRDLAFQLHIWDHDDVQVVERPKVCSRLLKYQQVLPGRLSFKEVLRTEKKPSLAMRIKLASTFARSLLQLYESPWSSSRWDKDHLTFFFTEYGKPDLDRPYLSTTFDKSSLQGDVVDPSLVHSNIGILKLGILLIEVYKWKPIEHYRQPGDMNQDGTPNANTDIWVAFRMLDKMEGSLQGYFDSVFGCLNLPWKQPGARVSLEDESTRDGFYRVVLQPLQGELEKIEEDEKRREEKLRDTKRRGGYR